VTICHLSGKLDDAAESHWFKASDTGAFTL